MVATISSHRTNQSPPRRPPQATVREICFDENSTLGTDSFDSMQRATKILGRRLVSTASTPCTVAGSFAAERRRLVRSVPAAARSGVASVFDTVAKNLKHRRTPLFGLNAQFRAYATESPSQASPKQPSEPQQPRDTKAEEQKKFEEQERRLQQERRRQMDEGTLLWQFFLFFPTAIVARS